MRISCCGDVMNMMFVFPSRGERWKCSCEACFLMMMMMMCVCACVCVCVTILMPDNNTCGRDGVVVAMSGHGD